VAHGRAALEAVTGSLIYADGPKVAALGVDDLIIVATHERVLVAHKSQDQQLRRLAERADEE
jgi:mannose-1-phosphate guanylyltransferase/mannose-1-phosphate guanylyltransferase/mannose-6-phosphate isomerase